MNKDLGIIFPIFLNKKEEIFSIFYFCFEDSQL